MNTRAFPVEGNSAAGVDTDFRRQMQAWRVLLSQCARKPGRKSVHGLRVATLRLQAWVQFWQREQQPDALAIRTIRRWLRQGKKLRRALGAVRQEDVSLAKLKRVRRWAIPAAGEHLAFPEESLGTLNEMERSIKRRRASAAKKLVAEIGRRHKRLIRLSRKVVTLLGSFSPAAQAGAASPILSGFAAVAAEFPVLSAGNLHDFRKRIKNIRYLAEIFAAADLDAARHAAALKRMTGALGEWHDWQILAQEADHAELKDAATYLHIQTNRSLERALKLCRQSIARLLGRGTINPTPHPAPVAEHLPPRKPVVRATNGIHRARPGTSVQVS